MSRVNKDTEAMTPAQEDTTQSDPRLQLGQILKEARIAKELSYDDVVKATCIRQKIIEALEGGNFNKIGSETYIKGFIKTYATFLGLFPDTLLELYEESPVTKKYVHPFDMAFPSPISMAPTRKLILTCGIALFFLLISFTLYDQHMRAQQDNQDFVLSKFSSYLDEGDKATPEQPQAVALVEEAPLMPFGNPAMILKQVGKRYNLPQGADNIVLDPNQIGWVELYQDDTLILRTKLRPSSRYYMNKEPGQKIVAKEGNWLRASYKGQTIPMSQSQTCNDHFCAIPQ